MMIRKAPSLVDLCVRMAIDNVRYLGDVGCIDSHLLDRIVSHCTIEHLAHIEDRTQDRDLSPVTDKYWMKFFEKEFGADKMAGVIESMRQRNKTFPWRKLYEAKLKKSEDKINESRDKLSQRYKEGNASKKTKSTIKLCSKVPPSSNKRSYWGGPAANNIYNTKSRLLKKAKIEFINCREVKNAAAMKRMAVQRNHSSVPSKGKTIVASGFASSSSNKPVQRRF